MPRIGVRGLPQVRTLPVFDDFEVDALDAALESARSCRKLRQNLLSHQEFTLSLGLYFLRGHDSIERRERARLAAERALAVEAKSSVILVPPSLEENPSLIENLRTIANEFNDAGLASPFVDGRFARALPIERVGDPLWHATRTELRTRMWRIHGYHPTRWVRLYSREALEGLARAAFKHQPERIVFAHSQRWKQGTEFATILRALK